MEEKIINTEKYKCLGFINSTRNQHLQKYGIDCGYANGYVAIPPEHPLYGIHYDDINTNIEVHGGLTFSERFCFFKRTTPELLDSKIPDNYWVFGFDTMHYGDTLEGCPREYCISEVNRLKKILENWK